jgi:hypothetical protein
MDMSVWDEWDKRLNDTQWQADVNNSVFLSAMKRKLKEEGGRNHSDGSRTALPNAVQEGIAATVEKFVPGAVRKPVCPAIEFPDLTLQKRADVFFTIGDRQLIFEVKTALEFNSLAAAGAEASLYKSNNKDVIFVLFSLAGKGGFDSEKATKIAKSIFGGAIDEIVVLSLEVGKANGKKLDVVWNELIQSLNDFEIYLSKLV